jgi:SEC-C motif
MAKLGRNDPCGCGSGRKAKRCCAIERGPSRESVAHAYLSGAARTAVPDLDTVSDEYFEVLCAELRNLPVRELSLQVELPKLVGPALERLLDAMECDDLDAGEAPFAELLDKLDTPPRRAELARAVVALRQAGTLAPDLAAAALVDLASGSRLLFAAGLLEAAAVRAGIARTPGGLVLAA